MPLLGGIQCRRELRVLFAPCAEKEGFRYLRHDLKETLLIVLLLEDVFLRAVAALSFQWAGLRRRFLCAYRIFLKTSRWLACGQFLM